MQHDVITEPVIPGTADAVEITAEGFKRLKAELSLLATGRRPALQQQIQRATLFMTPPQGTTIADSARHDLEMLDKQIAGLEDVLRRVHVVDPDPGKKTVQLGSTVTVRYEDGTEEVLTVVGSLEADPGRGLISNESPVGQAVLGKAAGADVSVGEDDEVLWFSVLAVNLSDPRTDDSTRGVI